MNVEKMFVEREDKVTRSATETGQADTTGQVNSIWALPCFRNIGCPSVTLSLRRIQIERPLEPSVHCNSPTVTFSFLLNFLQFAVTVSEKCKTIQF